MIWCILSAKDGQGNALTLQQIEEDLPQLLKANEVALAEEPTWEAFGGVLGVNGHEYQVC